MIIYGTSRSIQLLITAGSATIVSVNEATKQCYCNGQKLYATLTSIFSGQFFLVAASTPSSFSFLSMEIQREKSFSWTVAGDAREGRAKINKWNLCPVNDLSEQVPIWLFSIYLREKYLLYICKWIFSLYFPKLLFSKPICLVAWLDN